jgi:hypothetical protein
MTLDALPAELRELITRYQEERSRSNAAWSDRSGSITANAARVKASDDDAAAAAQTRSEIGDCCTRHGIDPAALSAFLQ